MYDVFCEGCGYSLLGLSGSRCPECGKPYDPTELPFARIPWLHRRRLGKVRAYWKTVWMVAFSPRRFAAELCRPVRVSADDARRFRRATINIATAAAAMVSGPLLFAEASVAPPWARTPYFVTSTMAVVLSVLAFYFLLRLATDMPLFIWKGLPSLPPNQLSPVHHYASAPLAAALVLAPVFAVMIWIQSAAVRLSIPDSLVELLLLAEVLLVLLWLTWVWIVALVLMRTASRAPARRVLMLALYLPLHWFIMASMMLMVVALAMMIGTWALSFIWPNLRF